MEQLKNLLQKTDLPAVSAISEIITPEELKEAQEILTPEEIQTAFAIALREARLNKRAAIRTEEYRKKIFAQKPANCVSADQYYDWVLNKAKNEIKKFCLSEREEGIYKILCMYHTGDKQFEDHGYSFDKGILLYGGVGCGKTTMMRLMKENPVQTFAIVECMHVADQYQKEGAEVVHKFSKLTSVCFNDLGTEIESGESNHFGSKKNVMAEMILNHYERNQVKTFRMHFTTNLDADSLTQIYGKRVASRIREMCNIISLEGLGDKRK